MTFVSTGTYPTRSGNRVVPWIDGVPAFRRICQAIEHAQRSVWVTVTFMWPDFQMPDDQGNALDVLERAARRGIDVRAICWRPDDETASLRTNAFWGSGAHFDLLAERYPAIKIRWDRAHPGYCQHQKTWLVDAACASATAFVGGLNLNPHSVVMPGHCGHGQNHDLNVELTGPAVADVHHNFVQRWNEASEYRQPAGRWGDGSESQLPFPSVLPPPRGEALVQIQRTTHPGRYVDGHPPPEGERFPISAGERTNLHQYCAAIRSARRTIYLEHQHLEAPPILHALTDALGRNVQIVAMLPITASVAGLAQEGWAHQSGFTLCAMAGRGPAGVRHPVHIHSKLMIIDDECASVGSCNLHRYSLYGNGELNVAFHDPVTVRALRAALFSEHLAVDTTTLDDTAALRLFREVARQNQARQDRADTDWQGMAFARDFAAH